MNMDRNKQSGNPLTAVTDRLFGGLGMSWLKVVLFAVVTAAVTAVFLIVPVFRNTSFARMGETLEAWIFFAVIMMANCEKPLESAQKTFVFFLISQPLIYLLQVPFSWQGWGLFHYYRYWFILTLLTFPLAYAGWYIRKRNWLSLLILLPVLVFLAVLSGSSFRYAFVHFPYRLVTALFCLAQVLLYLTAFTSDWRQKLTGAAVSLAAVVLFFAFQPQINIDSMMFLPDDPILTEDAAVSMEDSGDMEITIAATGENSMVRIQAKSYGTREFTIQDGEAEYLYTAEIYEDETGHTQIQITPR